MPKKKSEEKKVLSFFNVYRKRGFGISLETINSSKKGEMRESEFFELLKNNKSYLNEFYRSKKDLIDCEFIGYKLDESYEKVLYITEKGKEFLAHLKNIESLIAPK